MKKECIIREENLNKYSLWLIEQEKSKNTIEKYLRDARAFFLFLPADKKANKKRVLAWKNQLLDRYSMQSMNSMLVSLNSFLRFNGLEEYYVKLLKHQRQMFCNDEKELSRNEYKSLVETAKKQGNNRLSLLIETICATGIRVSELKYITLEVAKKGTAQIKCKGKYRVIFVPKKLCNLLCIYAKKCNITTGHIFRTKSGCPLDRSNIWYDMKKLCKEAGVEKSKVFPHNLRHLFARTFYSVDKDIVKLADILGHSSIETTRIYTITSGNECAQKIDRLGLVISSYD